MDRILPLMHTSISRLIVSAAVGALLASPAGATDLFGSGPLELQAGGMVLVTPKYEGSKEYEVFGVPLVAPSGSSEPGFIQFRGPEDIRLRVINWNGFEAGPLAGWRFDREESDDDRLLGLGDVDGGIVLGGYAAYNFGMFKPFVSYSNQVSGDDTGGLLRFGAEAPISLGGGIKMTGIFGATWADDDYMDAFFSLSAAQVAAAPAFNTAYDAGAGVKDVYVGLNADVPLTDVWTLKLTGQYSRLVGDAADSPIVESEDQFFGGLGLTYRFTIDR
jgi:outer membrane scaffolding protein for murein synthesis (MipA/OmpV family)